MMAPVLATEADGLRQALARHFVAGWAGRTPVDWPNDQQFKAPMDKPWVRFSATAGPARRASLGAKMFRRGGLVTVQVFTVRGTGDGEGIRLGDAAGDLFREVQIPTDGGSITFGAPDVHAVGDDGAWWQTNMSVSFLRDWFDTKL